jgi:hypothetical protein
LEVDSTSAALSVLESATTFDIPAIRSGNFGDGEYIKAMSSQKRSPDGNYPAGENYGVNKQFPGFGDDFLDRAFFPDAMFDDQNIRSMFADCTLSGGMFWDKESGCIVEGVPEIPLRVSQVLDGVVLAGLLESNPR